jgi:aryl-alcohol dehydrogenase-like predicted oxidoreductase
MSHGNRFLTRRDALKLGLAAGAGFALQPHSLLAQAAAGELLSKPIPSSGERIPLIGIGTARRYDIASTEAELAPLREVLRAFPGMGGKLIDTAPSYGSAETVVGNLLEELGIRDEIFLATKVGAGRQGREAGIAEMEGSLQRLKTEHVDLLEIHNLAGTADMLPVLREWKQAGRIRYYGITTTNKEQYEALAGFMRSEPLDFIQVDYAIDNRSAEDLLLPLAQERGIAVLTALPFGRGRVFDAFGDTPVPEWAAELGIETWAQFALKFNVSHPAITAAIPGTARPEYLADNFNASRGVLPDAATRERMAALVANA